MQGSQDRPNPPTMQNTPDDEVLTRAYLEHAKDGVGWRCWGCGFYTEDQNEWIRHFQKHVDDFLGGSWPGKPL